MLMSTYADAITALESSVRRFLDEACVPVDRPRDGTAPRDLYLSWAAWSAWPYTVNASTFGRAYTKAGGRRTRLGHGNVLLVAVK